MSDVDIHLEKQASTGKQTGNAVVVLADRREVMRARDRLNKHYIGNRYVELTLPCLRDL